MEEGAMLVGSWRMNYHVATVATLNRDQARTLLFGTKQGESYETWYEFAPRSLLVTIDYPLDPGIQVKIPAKDFAIHDMASLGLFLLAVAKEYVQIYKDPEKYRIWGHGITDLYFESVKVSKHGVVELGMGS